MILLDLPMWLTGFNFLMGLFTLLVMVGVAIIVLLMKGKGEVATMQVDRAVAAEALVKTREAERDGKAARVAEIEEELEGITAEHRTLVGVRMAELFEFWSQKEAIEAKMANLERENRILLRRLDGDK